MSGRRSPAPRLRTDPARAGELPLLLPTPSALPGRIRPEAAVPCAEAFDDPGWWFSVDWDGSRALLFTGDDAPRLQGERLDDIGAHYPEVLEAAASISSAAVLDGVVCVLDPEGRPDLRALGRRMAVGPAAREPVVFLATDILHLDGAPVTGWPLDRRVAALERLLPPDSRLQVPEHVAAEGVAFAEAAVSRRLPGVLARERDAPYRAGVASRSRLRISLENEVNVVVVGIEGPPRRPRCLLLGEYVDGRLVQCGRLDGGWPDAIVPWLAARVAELTTAAPVCEAAVAGASARWLRPGLVATVLHQGRGLDSRLQRPGCVALRDDVDPAWCVRRAPVPPPGGAVSTRRFRPAVIRALPLDG